MVRSATRESANIQDERGGKKEGWYYQKRIRSSQ